MPSVSHFQNLFLMRRAKKRGRKRQNEISSVVVSSPGKPVQLQCCRCYMGVQVVPLPAALVHISNFFGRVPAFVSYRFHLNEGRLTHNRAYFTTNKRVHVLCGHFWCGRQGKCIKRGDRLNVMAWKWRRKKNTKLLITFWTVSLSHSKAGNLSPCHFVACQMLISPRIIFGSFSSCCILMWSFLSSSSF